MTDEFSSFSPCIVCKTIIDSNDACDACHEAKELFIPSGNKVIDDFISYTLANSTKYGRMMFVPYDNFKNIEFIGEGGFSRIYKATWINSKISWGNVLDYSQQDESEIVVLKKLKNSKNITSKELNELKIFFHYSSNRKKSYDEYVNIYYGITQDPTTQDLIFIMPYYNSDLSHYIVKNYYFASWNRKMIYLKEIINGLVNIHDENIVHRDLHSGNILLKEFNAKICDLGTSKSAIELTDNEEDIYGIIPYVASEVLHGKKYTTASDIYSFGMIMWEVMVGRRPFWDRNHNTELIIEICDGLRPPIITNAPRGFINLMKKCWHPDPEIRPTAAEALEVIHNICFNGNVNQIEIIKSPDIGPVTTNNPDAIYKSRYLSDMIKSAASTRSLRSKSITSELDHQRSSNNKRKSRKFEDNNQSEDNFDNGKSIKKIKLIKYENKDYATKELEFDIFDIDTNSKQPNNDKYTTREIGFDI